MSKSPKRVCELCKGRGSIPMQSRHGLSERATCPCRSDRPVQVWHCCDPRCTVIHVQEASARRCIEHRLSRYAKPSPEVLHEATRRDPALCVSCNVERRRDQRIYGKGDGSLYECVPCARRAAREFAA